PENITYNNMGLVQNRTDRAGTSFSYEYNERQQLTSEKLAGVINNVAQTQETKYTRSTTDIFTQKVNVAINGVATTSQAVTTDSLGRVRSMESTVGSSFNAKVNGTSDNLGRLTRLTDVNSGMSTNYVYTKTRLQSVQTNGSATVSIADSDNAKYEYYANGTVKKITYPILSSGQSLTSEFTYNKALGWVESVTNKNGSTVLSSYLYTYDNNGNVKTIDAKVGTGATQTTTYGYDGLNRLISAVRSTGGTDTYTYDVKGNRLTQTKSSGTDIQVQDTSYSYDLKNVLMAMTVGAVTSNFAYYADGLRFSKTTAGVQTKYIYDYNGQVISSEKSNGEKASYIRGDRLLVKKDRTNSTAVKDYYYLYNGHGDVVQIVDKSGAIVNSYAYDEWGNITSQTEGIQNS
ncbi:YD repeat-containing protein, partial [Paenibacillus sp. PastH-2]|nr:YD repeat-containing protein [Paenibacillus sp. PastH-2]